MPYVEILFCDKTEARALFAAIAAGYTVTGVGGSKTFLPSCERIRQAMAEFGR
ncbi:MAG: hypothetical protein H5T66_10180 [Chloroflexi bacterium]|nr:hypothetical protein [Chloroflexota bacterium]